MRALEPLKKGLTMGINIKYLWLQTFSKEIINAPALEGFHIPKIDLYDGFTDPVNHLQRYVIFMRLPISSCVKPLALH